MFISQQDYLSFVNVGLQLGGTTRRQLRVQNPDDINLGGLNPVDPNSGVLNPYDAHSWVVNLDEPDSGVLIPDYANSGVLNLGDANKMAIVMLIPGRNY